MVRIIPSFRDGAKRRSGMTEVANPLPNGEREHA